jgi:hypothetical protein
MSIHLSLSDVPTHVVLWQEKEKLTQLVESLVQRIGTLEASVNSLLTKTKKDTPLLSGIDTRRGVPPLNIVQEADPRNLLKELIETAPLPGLSGLSALPTVSALPGNIYEVTNGDSNIKVVQVSDTKNTMATPLIYTSMLVDSEDEEIEKEEEEVEVEVEVEEQHEAEEQQEEDAEQEEEQQEQQEEEEEEQQEELTEFEFKGVTYWRDSENQVYKVDDDGDLDDTPFGLWSSEKNKILKFQTV